MPRSPAVSFVVFSKRFVNICGVVYMKTTSILQKIHLAQVVADWHDIGTIIITTNGDFLQ